MQRFFQVCLLIMGTCLSACAEDESGKVSEAVEALPEISIGKDSAPVTLIQYTAFSCSHCADFHKEVMPQIEKKYVEPGYVKVIFRDYPVDNPSLRAAQVAWCGGPLRYLDMVQLLFSTQQKWLFADDPVEELKVVAASKGIDQPHFEQCIHDGELMDKIIQIRQEGQKNYEITATPTLIINDKIIPYAMTFEEFEEAVRPLLDTGESSDKA